MEAGDAYAAANNPRAAFDEYYKAYLIRIQNRAPRPDIRSSLYKMRDMTQPDTERRAEVDKLIADFQNNQ